MKVKQPSTGSTVVQARLVRELARVTADREQIWAELQESDDDSTYTAVADAALEFPLWQGLAARVGTATGTFFQSKTTGAADVAGLYEVGYRGSKRYIKVNVRLTGTHTNGTPTAVSFSQGQPAFTPAY